MGTFKQVLKSRRLLLSASIILSLVISAAWGIRQNHDSPFERNLTALSAGESGGWHLNRCIMPNDSPEPNHYVYDYYCQEGTDSSDPFHMVRLACEADYRPEPSPLRFDKCVIE